jgi:hypothetical protein
VETCDLGCNILKPIDSELKELAKVIESAGSQAKLVRFVQGRDNALSIRYHTEKLDSIIAALSVRESQVTLECFLIESSLGSVPIQARMSIGFGGTYPEFSQRSIECTSM